MRYRCNQTSHVPPRLTSQRLPFLPHELRHLQPLEKAAIELAAEEPWNTVKLLALFFDIIAGLLGFDISIRENLANRTDRGKFKPDSEKYVAR